MSDLVGNPEDRFSHNEAHIICLFTRTGKYAGIILSTDRSKCRPARENFTNKNIKMRSFKSSENIQKKEGGPDRSVSDNQSSSVTLNELAMKARKDTVISSFSKEVIH